MSKLKFLFQALPTKCTICIRVPVDVGLGYIANRENCVYLRNISMEKPWDIVLVHLLINFNLIK